MEGGEGVGKTGLVNLCSNDDEDELPKYALGLHPTTPCYLLPTLHTPDQTRPLSDLWSVLPVTSNKTAHFTYSLVLSR